MTTTGEVAAYVGVGSNLEPAQHVPRAVALVAERLRLTGISTFYRTAPIGAPGQPPFWNGVLEVATALPPRQVKFDVLREIEATLGRRRSADRYAPRPIDLDLLLCGGAVIDEPDLKLPDPDLRHRAFLWLPLLELAPALRLPDTGEPLAALKRQRGAGQGMEEMPEVSAALRAAHLR